VTARRTGKDTGSAGGGRRKERSKARRRASQNPALPGVLRVLGIAAAGLFVGYLTAVLVLFPSPGPPRDLRPLADLRNRPIAEATQLLAEAGLAQGAIRSLRLPGVDSGRVLGQSPLPTQLVREGDTVSLVVSLGPERRDVPEVRRLRADRAVDLLLATGFEVRVDSVDSPLARGRIVEIEPAEGTPLELPGEVSVTVSLGPPTVRMPFVLGLLEEEARDTLSVLGLEVVEVEEVFRFGRDQGRVVTQDPAEDSELERGSEVRLQIGRRGGNRKEH
jgi:serine/threonine-protein kinase